MAKKVITWIVVPFMLAIFILDIMTVAMCNSHCAKYSVKAEAFDGKNGNDRIHFINTANSDAILLESNGHFALIDAGEGSFNPRRSRDYRGFEDVVIAYLKKAAADNDGKIYLDFVLGTHYHYDHVGSFHAILTDSDITVGTAYFKKYDPSIGKSYEPVKWGLESIYEQIISDVYSRGFMLSSSLPDAPFAFGDFTLQFFNTVTPSGMEGEGENAASVGVKVTKGKKSAFLASDITSSTGLEQLLQDKIGEVNLLKIGHHGYFGSSSKSFVRALKPQLAIVTNRLGKIYPNVKWNLTVTVPTAIFATYDNNGLIASFTDNGEIILSNHSCD